MNSRQVGNTGISVSEIGMGTWELGGEEWGDISEDDAVEVLRYAFDRGITFFDTADVYGPGRSEQLLGRAFGGMDDQVVIASKCGYQMGTDGWISRGGPKIPINLSREHILEACDDSLKRLERERIDFYQMHGPPDADAWEEAFGAMDELKKAGKVAHYGVALSGDMDVGVRVLNETGASTLMLTFNALEQSAAEAVLPLAKQKGVGVFARVPLASGFLTGTLSAETIFPANDKRRVLARDAYLAQLARADKLRFLADVKGVDSMAEGALKFVLAHDAIPSVVAGMMRPLEVDQNLKASGDPLPSDVVSRVHALYESGFA
jgi:aryl-alcohol dehydrogenase-like predicted oxidoreductase